MTAPVAMTADDLPTWQTNGIVWAMAQADGVVFAGGTFSAIRPPGAPAGTNEKPAVNFSALDAATGKPTSCSLSFTVGSGLATVRALAVSPDHKTLYAGGRFGAVNGLKASNVAAIDIATCTPKAGFRPSVNATVRALDVTDHDVYLGGDFTSVAGQARSYFASVTRASGALRPWAANADKVARAIAVTPDGKNVILGGDFDTVNGADSHALAVVSSDSGALTKTYPSGFIPAMARVKDITVDATGFYTAGEDIAVAFDGRIAFNLKGFDQRWRDTCWGATQAVEVYKGVLYSASHAHDCTTMGGFPELLDRQHLLAQSVDDPKVLGWFPDTNDGLGAKLGPRVITTASKNGTDYMWVGGEFTTVNDKPAQGLTRFAAHPDTTAPSVPQVSASSTTPGKIDVHWQSSLDLDDSKLAYRVYRNGSDQPVYQITGSSLLENRPQLTFTDTHVKPGKTYTYRVIASDGTNTSIKSGPAKVTAATTVNAYANQVVADGADLYWRFEEKAGTFAADSSSRNNGGVHKGGPTRGVTPGAVPGSTSAVGYLGTSQYTYADRRTPTPATYSVETWIKTTTTTGGRIIGFDSRLKWPDHRNDKHLYMSNNGHVTFGVFNGAAQTISSTTALNDGNWHHLVATQGPGGMQLYADGALQASNPQVTTSNNYNGYWEVGGGDMLSLGDWKGATAPWPGQPTSMFLNGQIDETSVYLSALTPAQVAQHHTLGLGAEVSGAAAACTPSAGFNTCIDFTYSGDPQTITIPKGVTRVKATLLGASAYGPYGGKGGQATGTVAVTPGQKLTVTVGQQGRYSSGGQPIFGGGGTGGTGCIDLCGSGGGGMSALWNGGPNVAGNALLVAGGGGGAGNARPTQMRGGDGGGPTGGVGQSHYGGGGGGATQNAGGEGGAPFRCAFGGRTGSQFEGGSGASGYESGSGGGGGWFGGGGGGCGGVTQAYGGAGGGGSSYISGPGVTAGATRAGVNPTSANGDVKLEFTKSSAPR
ncbi:LamG-like jellyroll fold domain-containing protein [Streptomyces sp. NPDC093982]|uniref:LamG-like jellyroll fold domain-containing protein n=1 Tax=Streptomyces sp. NPDC093982 TaxID=3155077 RepID=UPI00343678AF